MVRVNIVPHVGINGRQGSIIECGLEHLTMARFPHLAYDMARSLAAFAELRGYLVTDDLLTALRSLGSYEELTMEEQEEYFQLFYDECNVAEQARMDALEGDGMGRCEAMRIIICARGGASGSGGGGRVGAGWVA